MRDLTDVDRLDTSWHVGYIKKDPKDSRRHKARCTSNRDGKCQKAACGFYMCRCPGSSHCSFYQEYHREKEKTDFEKAIDRINEKYHGKNSQPKAAASRKQQIGAVTKTPKQHAGPVVQSGCFVTVYDFEFNCEETFRIVRAGEASDSVHKRISLSSPIGKALEGRTVGETIYINLPNGENSKYRIIRISFSKKK